MIIAVTLLVAAVYFMISTRVGAIEGNAQANGRLITIHDRGTQSVISTTAATVGEALEEAGVEIDKSDAVEPATSEALIARAYDVNIYRARPVIVVDGTTKQKVITPYQTASQIAKSAGIDMFEEDTTKMSRSDDIVSDGAGLRLTIDRATPFTFTLYGKTTTARTQGETVGEMLKEKGIVLGASDRVSTEQSANVTQDMAIRVWREGKQTITVDEEVAFETEKIQDGDQKIGYKAIKSAGQNGSRSVTYEIIIQDGNEVGRTEIASIPTKEAIKQVEIIGVKSAVMPYTGGGSKSEWLLAAGIPQSDWAYADSIVQRESSWNPNALNSSSGACGLAQALPCSKVPGNPFNPVDSLRWQKGYVDARYGGYAGAYQFWQVNRWY
jgi:uncharacterized protein YabE (DUF348 family)